MIIDGDGAVLGRLASKISKRLLKGEHTVVINAEKIVITGNPKAVLGKFKEKIKKGDPHKGPFQPRYPDRVLRRAVRGMLPFKTDRGRTAYRRLKVHMGNPNSVEGQKIGKNVDDLRSKYITLKDLGKRLGAKIE